MLVVERVGVSSFSIVNSSRLQKSNLIFSFKEMKMIWRIKPGDGFQYGSWTVLLPQKISYLNGENECNFEENLNASFCQMCAIGVYTKVSFLGQFCKSHLQKHVIFGAFGSKTNNENCLKKKKQFSRLRKSNLIFFFVWMSWRWYDWWWRWW